MSILTRLSARAAPIRDRISNEPVAVATGASMALSLAVAFGAPISPDQKLALGGAFVAVANWWARSKSMAVNKLVTGAVTQSAPAGPVTVVSPDGSSTTIGAQP